MIETKTSGSRNKAAGATFTGDEKAAMREAARERKAQARSLDARTDGERDVRAKIAEMPAADRVIAERVHALVTETVPELVPRTWYGMPAYTKNDKLVCFFKSADKFKTRYATIGFEEAANLDDGAMWPTSYAVTKLTAAGESRISELLTKAAS